MPFGALSRPRCESRPPPDGTAMKRLGEAAVPTWEKVAESCPYSTFFHTPAWARIVGKTFPTARATAQSFRMNGTTVVLPTTEYGAEGKGFFRAYFSNYLGVYGGPISDRALSPHEIADVLDHLESFRAKRVDLIGNPYLNVEPDVSDGWRRRMNFTQVVPLDTWTNEKELMGRYEHQVRNSVHRSERRGYGLRLASTRDDISAYYGIYRQAMDRYGNTATGRYPLNLFVNALAEGPEKAPFWLATKDGQIVGGILSFVHNKRWIAWNAAFSEEEFPHGLAKYFHHQLIMEAQRRGCVVYDFNPSGGHEGTVRFKEMYGAEKRYFWELTRSEGATYRAFRRLKGMPTPSSGPVAQAIATNGVAPSDVGDASGRKGLYNVAHFRTPFLSITETFIYGVLKNLKAPIQPVVFTESVSNTDLFPFPRIVNYSLKKGSLLRFLNGIFNFLLGNNVGLLGLHFRRNDIRLIHAHFGPEAASLAEAAHRLKIPLVTTFYGFDMSSCPQRAGWMEKYRRLFEKGDVFLVEGPHMFKKLVELGCPSTKAKVQRIGVDVDEIPYRERTKAAGEKMVFLFCGRFIEKKGLIYALQAFQRLIDEGVTNFEFRVMGDGPLMPEIKSYLDAHTVKDQTILYGYRPHAEFYRQLQEADVMVAPSVTGADGNSEGGAPTTILEAQAAGVPIVASLHADIPNVVLPGGSALLSPERDVPSLAANLRHMIEHPESLASFGRAGREFVKSNHDIATEAARLQEIYLALIEARARRT